MHKSARVAENINDIHKWFLFVFTLCVLMTIERPHKIFNCIMRQNASRCNVVDKSVVVRSLRPSDLKQMDWGLTDWLSARSVVHHRQLISTQAQARQRKGKQVDGIYTQSVDTQQLLRSDHMRFNNIWAQSWQSVIRDNDDDDARWFNVHLKAD